MSHASDYKHDSREDMDIFLRGALCGHNLSSDRPDVSTTPQNVVFRLRGSKVVYRNALQLHCLYSLSTDTDIYIGAGTEEG